MQPCCQPSFFDDQPLVAFHTLHPRTLSMQPLPQAQRIPVQKEPPMPFYVPPSPCVPKLTMRSGITAVAHTLSQHVSTEQGLIHITNKDTNKPSFAQHAHWDMNYFQVDSYQCFTMPSQPVKLSHGNTHTYIKASNKLVHVSMKQFTNPPHYTHFSYVLPRNR